MNIRFSCFFTACLAFLFFVFILFPAQGAAEENTKIITLTFTGDCTLCGEEWLKDQDYSFVSHVNRFGYGYPFENVRELFEEDDLTVINLENVFYDRTDNQAKKNFRFRAPTDFAKILSSGSVELAFLGNNHALDYGKPGLDSTILAIKREGVDWFGSNYTYNQTHIFEKDGIKIGFIGSYSAYWFSQMDAFRKAYQALEDAGCQVVIGVVHDGIEYAPYRHNRQMEMANWLVNRGAKLVIGHHPHVPQGVDVLGDATVVYSLGNFSFGGNKDLDIKRRPGKRADRALIARVELQFDEHKGYLGHQVNLIPVSPSGTAEYNNYQPVLLSGEAALETMALVQDDTPFTLALFVEGVGALQDFVPVKREEAKPAP